jgi:hypothetical protein
VSHGISRFRHGVTWPIRYGANGDEIKEQVGRETDGFMNDGEAARCGPLA